MANVAEHDRARVSAGLGFGIALAGVWFVAWTISCTRQTHRSLPMGSETNYSSKDVVLSGIEEQKHDGLTAIIGTATNKGAVPARSVDIQASSSTTATLWTNIPRICQVFSRPCASKHFKISCGCKDTPAAEHDSYKVTVITDSISRAPPLHA